MDELRGFYFNDDAGHSWLLRFGVRSGFHVRIDNKITAKISGDIVCRALESTWPPEIVARVLVDALASQLHAGAVDPAERMLIPKIVQWVLAKSEAVRNAPWQSRSLPTQTR